jgi:hypothetical protein
VNLAIGHRLTNPRRNLVKDVTCAVILDGVDGIQPQPVKMKFFDPINRVFNDELAEPAAS